MFQQCIHWILLPTIKWTGLSEEGSDLSDKIMSSCTSLYEKTVKKWFKCFFVNPDQENRLFTVKHHCQPNQTQSQPEDGGDMLLFNDRIKHTAHCENPKHNHCVDSSLTQHLMHHMVMQPSLCLIKYHAMKPYRRRWRYGSTHSSWH